ncbi:MAG: T9SS type A sorting domain-containing protein [Chitinophagales bacterium]|nr:T9SS type A sorting domain-containing protein [Chitinophagales bacterium]
MKRFIAVLFYITFILNSNDTKAQTFVGGTLSVNTIWTPKGNPYIDTSDLIIPANIILTLKPGVVLKFKAQRSILVDGTISAVGTADSVIIFSIDTLPTEQAFWSGIYIRSDAMPFDFISSSGCNFQHCILENGGTSNFFQAQGGGEFTLYSEIGIYLDHCMIRNGYCGCTAGSNSRISNNVFMHTTADVLSGPIVRIGKSSTVQSNIFYNNTVSTSAGMVSLNKNVKCFNNIFTKNDFVLSNSLYISDSSLFYGNTFTDNLDASILLEQGFCYNNTIVRNQAFNVMVTISNNNPHFYNNNLLRNVSEVQGNAFEFAGFPVAGPETAVVENNYWGSADSATIALLIEDQNDNSSLCRIDFVPFLAVPDINAPVIPPVWAHKKDLGNGQVQLTWSNNQETDLKGYKIYYKNFTGYSFTNSKDAGSDTTAIVDGVSITDTFAVTAYDLQATGVQDQLSGHESWFTIATLDTSTGISEVTKFFMNGKVSPNPLHDHFIIKLYDKVPGGVEVDIYNLYGRLEKTLRVYNTSETIDVHDLYPGLYIIKINSGGHYLGFQKIEIQ